MKFAKINTNKKVFIIAEIGNNHEGKIELAKKLIQKAAQSGVDAVKFQTIRPKHLINSDDSNRRIQLKKFELSFKNYELLFSVAKNEGIEFMSTPFDLEAADFLNNFVSVHKIASGDNDFYPLIEKIISFGKPIILSTGMASINQLKKTLNKIEEFCKKQKIKSDINLLHCVSKYPTSPYDANLKRINSLMNNFPFHTIGYSDHTIGNLASISAVVLGARIIEKHFTLNKNFSTFIDHSLSADPIEMKLLVENIRTVELMTKEKNYVADNDEGLNLASRRSIAINRNLKKGHKIKRQDLCWLRPGKGIRPGNENKLIGSILSHDIKEGTILTESDLIPSIK